MRCFKPSIQPCAIGLVLLMICLPAYGVGIWDGEYTEAKSGVEGELYDPWRTDGQSGLDHEDAPKSFHVAPERRWDESDLDEPDDYHNRVYSPYASLRLLQSVEVMTVSGKNLRLMPGYYLVKPVGILPANLSIQERLIAPKGESAINPEASWQAPPESYGQMPETPEAAQSKTSFTLSRPSKPTISSNTEALPALNATGAAPKNSPNKKSGQNPPPRYLMIKQTGKVLAILPLTHVCANTEPKKYRPKKAQVQMVIAPSGSHVLRYADKHWVADTAL
ncbi:MAG: hypothetical protein VKK59_01380 [Vampirovibrionales bacterium]|nr:hypothetical protein [Vampirovibrionales bacterium]